MSTLSPIDITSGISSELYTLVVTTIITVFLTVTITYFVQNYLDKPKIKGRIISILNAQVTPATPFIDGQKTKSFFGIYVYLTNQHKNDIAIIDYKLELDFGEGYISIPRLYQSLRKFLPNPFRGKDENGKTFTFYDLAKHSLIKKTDTVKYGTYIHGLAVFLGDSSLGQKKIQRLKFTSIDVFDRKHVIENKKEEVRPPYVLYELLDAEIQ